MRAIPNIEYFAAWFREPIPKSMPRAIYDSLSDHGKRICRYIVADEGQKLDVRYLENLGGTPNSSKSRPTTASGRE